MGMVVENAMYVRKYECACMNGESHEDSEDVSVSESRADVLVWLRGVFTRSPVTFGDSHGPCDSRGLSFMAGKLARDFFFFNSRAP